MKEDVHLCACWLNEPCMILDKRIVKNEDGVRIEENESLVGYITACGKKLDYIYYNEMGYLLDHITNCRNKQVFKLTKWGKSVTCLECRLLGSLEL